MTGEGKIMVKKVLGREGESYPVCSVLHFISASSMREKQTSADHEHSRKGKYNVSASHVCLQHVI